MADRLQKTTGLEAQARTVTVLDNLVRRAQEVFSGASNWFAPGEPIVPSNPEPEPRVRQMQVGSNLQYQPRGTESTSFEQLRFFSAYYDIDRICVERRKDMLCGVGWDVVAAEEGEEDQYPDEIRRATRFLERPDREHEWPTWLRLALEDYLVIDALTLYPRPTRKGDLYALEVIDGATIKPLVDARGKIPDPPAPAYQQILWGVPRGMWDKRQLLYLPANLRTETPYGYAETEHILYIINTALRKRLADLSHFTEGNLPAALLGVPVEWTPEQIQAYQKFFDDWLAGNQAMRSRLIFTPTAGRGGNMPIHEFAAFSGDPQFDLWLMKITVANRRLTMAELSQTDDVNRATGDSQENVLYRGIKVDVQFVQSVLNRVICDYIGYPFLRFKFHIGEEEDREKEARIFQIYNTAGVIQLDEERSHQGRTPFGVPPFVSIGGQIIFVDDLKAQYAAGVARGWKQSAPPSGFGGPPGGGPGEESGPDVAEGEGPGGEEQPQSGAGAESAPQPEGGDQGDADQGDADQATSEAEQAGQQFSPAAGGAPVTMGGERHLLLQAARDDLRRWRTVARKAAVTGLPCRPFHTEALPSNLVKAVQQELDDLSQVALPSRQQRVSVIFEKALNVLTAVDEAPPPFRARPAEAGVGGVGGAAEPAKGEEPKE